MTDMVSRRAKQRAVGIDVGGARKGFHAVALVGGTYLDRLQTHSVRDLVRWVRNDIGAQVVAIDAPCRWRAGKTCRAAERGLMEQGIRCFLTPTRRVAMKNVTGYYEWMLRGMDLFRALEKTHPLCNAETSIGRKCSFETFPHAITWHLRAGNADASRKRPQRLALLRAHGVRVGDLTNMDWIDAALCALAADTFAAGHRMHFYGDRRTGRIVVPVRRVGRGAPRTRAGA